MSKINVGTEFKAAYTTALRDSVSGNEVSEVDPRNYMKYVKTACEDIAERKWNYSIRQEKRKGCEKMGCVYLIRKIGLWHSV